MPVFRNEQRRNAITRLAWERGRIATVRLAFEEARATNPAATLLLNDFDMSTAYECLIEGVLEAGIQVDALGLQSHMHHGYWGEEKTLAILERFSRYELPIHMTETTLLSGHPMPPEIDDLNDYQIPSWPSTAAGEERQADEIVRHYRTLLSHPSVQSITYWGLSDDGAWLGAPAGLVRADGTRKPAYDALRGLVKGGGSLPPGCGRTTPGASRYAASSASISCNAPAARRPSPLPRLGKQRRRSGSSSMAGNRSHPPRRPRASCVIRASTWGAAYAVGVQRSSGGAAYDQVGRELDVVRVQGLARDEAHERPDCDPSHVP
jgi:endo-1,4-beta-xylanase